MSTEIILIYIREWKLVTVIFISRDGYPSESTITINFMDFDIVSRQHADFADPGTSAADNSAHLKEIDGK